MIGRGVIPAKAGIQEKTGFRVKLGMTNLKGLMSLCINTLRFTPYDLQL